ncbi:MAG: UvrD-helicase domain-containing protein, partial [Lentisphaeria bacterium]|nr:UvrD-helicase domain-containing protein [Lentisphaeria bacterium]
LASARQLNLTREIMTRPSLRILEGTNTAPEELELKIEEILKSLKQEYHPGLAGELMLPEPENIDRCLQEWKQSDDITETDENVLDIFIKLNEHFQAHAGFEGPNGKMALLCAELHKICDAYESSVLLHAAQWTVKQFAGMKERENFLTFDDLLHGVLTAVMDPRNPLRNLVRKQYRAAIVDEFQDTDPVQYEIFRRIFGEAGTGHILFFVGDPKQAIYGFRGGDTATYRTARDFVKKYGREYSLCRNYRSAEKLLDAVNSLFENCPRPPTGIESVFADPAVQFQPVSSGKSGSGLVDQHGEEDPDPLKFRWLTLSDPKASAVFSLNEILDRACRACAEDIVSLLASPRLNPETKRPLCPNEIAVLVPDNTDARRMRKELKKRNVPCVIPKSENVFKSAAAQYLKTVLKAVESPSDVSFVSEAMLTPLLGFSLDDMIRIHASVSGENVSEQLTLLQEKMLHLKSVWHQNSFLKMFQELLSCFEVRARLLKRGDGERILTDLLHLRDLIQQKISESGLSPSGVLSYLSAEEKEVDSEEKETMMETDRSAVVITTVHSSKGLEYPVVMLPLMFKKSFEFQRGRIACWHDADGQLNLSLSPDQEAIQYIELERKQELMRLLYVALTRAKYSCYLYWGLIKGKTPRGLYDQTAMDWLFPSLSGHDLRNWDGGEPIPQLRNTEIQSVMTDQLACTPWHPEALRQEHLILRRWQGKMDPDYHFTSFTALAGAHGTADGFDYDSGDSGNRLDNPSGIFKIPAGAQTGNAWHDIMEEIDFAAFDPQNGQDRDFIENKLEIFGVLNRGMKSEIRREYVDLTGEMIRQLLNTPLLSAEGTGFALRDISRSERFSELKFNYCFHQEVRTEQLIPVLSDYVRDTFGWNESGIAIRNLRISGGFLNGALDLLFRHDGKFYIADWKSNRINGHTSGFSPAGVNEEMAHHAYYLQYLIYTVAVMKYLALHLHHPLSEVDYDRLFGGVFYFFMRGVDCSRPGQGVFRARPPYALVRNLEQLIG